MLSRQCFVGAGLVFNDQGDQMYSQLGQDLLVIDILNGKRGGYFLDTGASDGVSSNNTLLLERYYDWTGLCIEPNRSFFEDLIRNRSCTCYNSCLYDRLDRLGFLEDAGMLGGVIEDFAEGHLDWALEVKGIQRDPNGDPPIVMKETTTLSHVLQAASAPQVIDYWSLDVEGAELRLLKSFPFDVFNVHIITVEHNNRPARGTIKEFLEGMGYELFTSLNIDDCYIFKDAFPSIHALSRAWGRRRLS